jgi:hypothetical protein
MIVLKLLIKGFFQTLHSVVRPLLKQLSTVCSTVMQTDVGLLHIVTDAP